MREHHRLARVGAEGSFQEASGIALDECGGGRRGEGRGDPPADFIDVSEALRGVIDAEEIGADPNPFESNEAPC